MKIRRSAQPTPVPTLPGIVRSAFRVVVATALVNVILLTAALGWVLGAAQPRLAGLRSGVNAVRDAQQAMLDQETGARAYLLIGTQQYLEPYHNGVRELSGASTQLVALVRAEPSLAVDVAAMRTAADRWQRQWGRVAAGSRGHLLDSDSQLDTYRTVLFLNSGKTLFDAFRAASTTVQVAAQRLLIRTVAAQDTTLGVTAGLTMVIGLLAVWLARRREQILRRDVVRPIDVLVEHIDHVRDGDLRPSRAEQALADSGPAELRRLGVGVAQMTATLARELAQSHERSRRLDAQAQQLMEVLDLARDIAGSLSVRYILDSVGRATKQVGGFAGVTVWLSDDSGRFVAAHDTELGKDVVPDPDLVAPGQRLVDQARRFGEVVVDQQPSGDGGSGEWTMVLPMIVGTRIIGAVECRNAMRAGDDEERVAILETLAVHAASAVEAARLYDKTSEQATTDALTRLANRRRLDADLALECERSGRYGRPLSFLMIDLDRFKQINDTYGHQRADEVLQEVAAILVDTVRTSDSTYRYGGEELCVLVRETGLVDAALLAERLRVRIVEHFSGPDAPPVTASFGVAELAPKVGNAEDMVQAADAAMYRAKRAGRNRVEVAESGSAALRALHP